MDSGAGKGVCLLTILVSICRLGARSVLLHIGAVIQVALLEELNEQVQDLDSGAGDVVCLLTILVKADSYNIIYYAFALSFPEY